MFLCVYHIWLLSSCKFFLFLNIGILWPILMFCERVPIFFWRGLIFICFFNQVFRNSFAKLLRYTCHLYLYLGLLWSNMMKLILPAKFKKQKQIQRPNLTVCNFSSWICSTQLINCIHSSFDCIVINIYHCLVGYLIIIMLLININRAECKITQYY